SAGYFPRPRNRARRDGGGAPRLRSGRAASRCGGGRGTGTGGRSDLSGIHDRNGSSPAGRSGANDPDHPPLRESAGKDGDLTAIERAGAARSSTPAPPRIDETSEMNRIASDLKESADTTTAKLAEIAAKRMARERAKTGGLSSGKTMLIMASTLKQVQHSTK